MGKKSGPTVQPVDPVATANAQAQANLQTAQQQQKLNMIGTSGPSGSVMYQADPSQPGGYTQVTSLSPSQQAIYDASNQAQQGALGVANQQIGRVSTALGQTLNTSSLPPLVGSVGAGGQPMTYGQPSYGSPGPGKQGAAAGGYPAGGSQQSPAAFSGADDTFSGGGPRSGQSIQSALGSLGMGKPGVPGQSAGQGGPGPGKQGGAAGQYPTGGASMSPAQGGPQQQSLSHVQPGAMPSTDGIQTTFNKGGPLQYSFNPGQSVQGQVGPQDFNQAVQNTANSVYSQATSRLDPQFAQSENALRTKLANQGLSQNDDAYQTALNNFSQGKNDAYNQAIYSSIGAGNAEQNQLFGQQLQQGQFANSAAAQQYAQNQGLAAFNNQTAGQDYSQNLGAAQFGNSAQQQLFNQQSQNQQTGFQQGLANAQLGLSSQNQQFNQGLSNAQLSNTARQQGLQEQAYIQNTPINQFATLLGAGGQVAMPTGINYSPSQVANTDVLGAYALNQQGQIANQQAAAQRQAGMMGGLMSLGSAAIMASDRRLKRDAQLIRRRKDGVGVYRYRYVGDDTWRVGVMAQELKKVRPDLVVKRADGFLAVDYSGLDLEAA